MKLNVVVVIPNWNGADYIGECLKSLKKQTLKPKIIVVENGSIDNSLKEIAAACPEAKILKFKNNAGFAGGVNRGIRPAIEDGADYIALFNNDALADRNWLKYLVLAAEKHPEAGIITGKFMRLDKKHLDSTGDQYSTHAMPFPRGRNQIDAGQYNTAEEVFGATGGASLYRVSMLEEIGLFDEDFFAYYEDVDVSFRAQLAGWKVWYEPKAEAYHHVSATSSKLGSFSRYHSIKNFIMLYYKNMPGVYLWKYKFWFFERLARMLIGSLRDRQIIAFLRGLFKGLALMRSTLNKRHAIQSRRKVTPAHINSLLYPGSPPKIPKL